MAGPPPQLLQQIRDQAQQNAPAGPRPLYPTPGPMSFAPAPGGMNRGQTTALSPGAPPGRNYMPNRFSGQPTQMTGQPPPQMAPPLQAPGQMPPMRNPGMPQNPQMAQQQAQVAALRNPRPPMGAARV